jgi:hypothetical protein
VFIFFCFFFFSNLHVLHICVLINHYGILQWNELPERLVHGPDCPDGLTGNIVAGFRHHFIRLL